MVYVVVSFSNSNTDEDITHWVELYNIHSQSRPKCNSGSISSVQCVTYQSPSRKSSHLKFNDGALE